MSEAVGEPPRCRCGAVLEWTICVPGDLCSDCIDEQVEADRALADLRELDRLDERLRVRP